SWQVSNIHAGTGATNVVPGSLEIIFNFRHAPVSTKESLRSRLEAILQQHGLEYEIKWVDSAAPYLTPRGRLVGIVSEVIRDVCGIEPQLSCTGGTSDGRFIADICQEVVELGPVYTSIHKLNECVAVDDLGRLTALYGGVLARLLLP